MISGAGNGASRRPATGAVGHVGGPLIIEVAGPARRTVDRGRHELQARLLRFLCEARPSSPWQLYLRALADRRSSTLPAVRDALADLYRRGLVARCDEGEGSTMDTICLRASRAGEALVRGAGRRLPQALADMDRRADESS